MRRALYKLLRIGNDARAIRRGRIGKRIARRVTGRLLGRLFR